MTKKAAIEAAGVIVHRSDGEESQWLLVLDSKRREWGFPKGCERRDDSLKVTAKRELREETGLKPELVAKAFSIEYRNHDGNRKRATYYFAHWP